MTLVTKSSTSYGVTGRQEKPVPTTSDSLGDLVCFHSFERGAFTLFVPARNELSWPFLFSLMAHYSHLSPISVVLENCKPHFHAGFLSLGAPHEEELHDVSMV